jgi:hypothetical protein
MDVKILFCISFFLLTFHLAYGVRDIDIVTTANSIPITISSSMKDVVFDGKWTFQREWKESSVAGFSAGEIRVAHFENFVYVLIDATSLTNFEKNSDRAMVCFDTKNDNSTIPNSGDYCFTTTLGTNTPITFQGDSNFTFNNNFRKISSSDGLIAVGGISDDMDRYTSIQHQSYEFKIPTDLIGRSDKYGFYVSVFDSHSNKIYSWPDMKQDSPLKIPSPKMWGVLWSPDKSLPEFTLPSIVMVTSFLVMLYFFRFKINLH